MASILKSLKFTTIPKANPDPTLARRAKLIERLQEQKALIQDPALTRKVSKKVQKEGQAVMEVREVKVLPWWRTDEKGQVVFFIRSGWKLIELEKGKPGVLVGDREHLGTSIDIILEALNAGELDLALRSVATPASTQKALSKG